MSLYQKYGFAVDQVLSEDQALPNATSGDSTNTVQLNLTGSNDIHVVVCSASVTTELAGGATLEIRPTVGLTADAVDVVLPSVLITQAVQSDASWASGEMITQFVLPAALLGSYRYLKLTYVTSADESADKVDAFTIIT